MSDAGTGTFPEALGWRSFYKKKSPNCTFSGEISTCTPDAQQSVNDSTVFELQMQLLFMHLSYIHIGINSSL